MAVRLHLASGLLPGQESAATWNVEARTLVDCVDAIEERFPGARQYLFDETGRGGRRHVFVYVNGTPARALDRALLGDEVVVFEAAETTAVARTHAIRRLKGRGQQETDQLCVGGLTEGVIFTGVGVAFVFFSGIVGNLIPSGAGSELSLGSLAVAVAGLAMGAWGVWNLFNQFFD